MALLADEYASGLWIKQDMEKANQLRQQAAAAGSRLAQWEVE
jgi:TPR repeat protein